MTEFVLDGFSCRAEGSGDVLVMLFSGFDEQLFREVCGLVPDCRCVLAEFGEIDWDRDYSPWEASSGGRRFSGGAERLLAFLPDFTAELEKRFGRFGSVYLCGYSLGGLFALYADALWDEPRLCGAASCSGSTWFPGWLEFQRLQPAQGQDIPQPGRKGEELPRSADGSGRADYYGSQTAGGSVPRRSRRRFLFTNPAGISVRSRSALPGG